MQEYEEKMDIHDKELPLMKPLPTPYIVDPNIDRTMV